MLAICSLILIVIASYFKGKMDTIMFRGRNIGWKNKWKLTADGKLKYYKKKDWYYFGHYPLYEEKFVYSSTILVCFTDAWHKYQFFMLRAFYLSVAIQMVPWYLALVAAFIVFPVIYGIGFYISFEKLSRQ